MHNGPPPPAILARLTAILIATMVGFSPLSARADTCTAVGTYACDSSGTDICSSSSGHTLCGVTYGTSDSTGGVLYGATIGTNWEFWGSDADGLPFCCVEPTGTSLTVYGGDNGDTVDLNYDIGGTLYHLTGATTDIWGYGGDDHLSGADDSTGADYIYGDDGSDIIHGLDGDDYLEGDDDADTIYGGVGDDVVDGGSGNDTCHGDGGDDTMYGGGNDDIMTGDNGNDVMYGNNGVDYMSGGNNDDTMDGGAAGDVLCGDADTTNGDTLNDGDAVMEATPDILWGNNPAIDDLTCQAGATGTRWDGLSNTGGCAGHPTIASRPPQCP